MKHNGPGSGIIDRVITEGGVDYSLILDGKKAVLQGDISEEDLPKPDSIIFTNPSGLFSKNSNILPSVSLVRFGKVKPLIDGIYAVVENHIASHGHNYSRPDFLQKLEEKVTDSDARLYVQVARAMGGELLSNSDERLASALGIVKNELGIFQPQGFYDWSKDLTDAFRQIKVVKTCPGFFLGNERDEGLNKKVFRHLMRSISDNTELSSIYNNINSIYAKLTDSLEETLSLFPQSRILYEEKLFKEISLEAQSDIPTNLGNALVEALRNGRIYLTPNKDSGLYTRQMHEVSSLVTQSSPEFDKFKPNETYYKILEREFISNWVTTHHTHIGHMGHIDFNIVTAADIKSSIIIKPQLSIEPFPTVYERMADNLVFLNNTLTSAFGEQFINKQRLDCNGRGVGTSIGEELCNLQSILRGLSYLSKDSIHMPYQCNTTAQESLNDAINWLKNISEDYDLEREAPIFTPIINGTYGSQYISYIIPGFTLAPISIFYSSPPNVSLKPYTRDYEFGSSSYLLPRLVHKEVRVSKDKLLNDRILKESLPRNLNLGQFEEFCNAL
ncbi:hypothetical protein J4461_00620 [Candidatus Pacearchaeota archaeon]|nr:hypothetical protein [Candidatus Pacearchaeota archaeon]